MKSSWDQLVFILGSNRAARFELRQDEPILSVIRQITDSGRGQELERALTLNEIKNELWTWVSY